MKYYTSDKNYDTICIYRDEEEHRKYKKKGYSNITQKEAYEHLLKAYVVRDGITNRMLQRKDIEFILNNSF